MKKLNYFIVIALMFSVFACNSSSKLFKKGEYYRAVIEAVHKLRSKPTSEKNQQILLKAYPLAEQTSLRNISNALASGNNNRYDVLVSEYEKLNSMADEIYRCPKALELIPAPKLYITELEKARDLAAETNYDLGVAVFNKDVLEQARLALQYFQAANRYVPAYRDVLEKIAETTYAATLRVLVNRPKTSLRYQVSADFFFDNLITEMNRTTRSRLVYFYTPEEAKNENMRNPHHYLNLDFADFSVGNIKEYSTKKTIKRDSIPVKATVNGEEQIVLITAEATLITVERQIYSSGTLSLVLADALNNKVLQRENFSSTYLWKDVWGHFSGDDRALSAEQKLLCRYEPIIPPDNQSLFVELTKPIYTQTVYFIRQAYQNY